MMSVQTGTEASPREPNFGGLRVVAFESRMASETAQLIERNGGHAMVAPAMREIPLGDNPAALERNLMFSGHNAFRFAKDPYYSNGFIPTVKQLVERILTGR